MKDRLAHGHLSAPHTEGSSQYLLRLLLVVLMLFAHGYVDLNDSLLILRP